MTKTMCIKRQPGLAPRLKPACRHSRSALKAMSTEDSGTGRPRDPAEALVKLWDRKRLGKDILSKVV